MSLLCRLEFVAFFLPSTGAMYVVRWRKTSRRSDMRSKTMNTMGLFPRSENCMCLSKSIHKRSEYKKKLRQLHTM